MTVKKRRRPIAKGEHAPELIDGATITKAQNVNSLEMRVFTCWKTIVDVVNSTQWIPHRWGGMTYTLEEETIQVGRMNE